MRPGRLKIFFDGGCRPNPGPLEIAVVVRGVAHVRIDLGEGSNSDAEWLAAIHALAVAEQLDERRLDLVGDSTLVVRQARGDAPCRSAGLQAHRDAFVVRAARFDHVGIRLIKRTQNLAGIALERLHGRR